MQYNIYTDGACSGNPGPGGWSAVINSVVGDLLTLSGNEKHTTNNRMELTAVIKALEGVPKDATINLYSDSQYVVYTVTKGWKRSKNLDLWLALEPLLKSRTITWFWIKGHNGNSFNEIADTLARKEIEKV